jgi:hypothetical protein
MAAPFNWPGNSMTCLVFADAGREADLVAGRARSLAHYGLPVLVEEAGEQRPLIGCGGELKVFIR